jgi:hypothetical protein
MSVSAALQMAYASVSETPLYTIRILHTGLSGGVLNLVQSKYDLTATLEDSTEVTFSKAGLDLSLLQKGVNGQQDLSVAMSNVSRQAWVELKNIIQLNRSNILAGVVVEKIRVELRAYLESDLTEPKGGVAKLVVNDSSVDLMSVKLRASYMQLADMTWPKNRYYADTFPGVKYA